VLEERVASFKLRLVRECPFYGTLALHAAYRLGEARPDALGWTDGRDIWLTPYTVLELPREECDFVLLHEVLHCALHHVRRRGERDGLRWNIAADIVVNTLLAEVPTVKAPKGVVTLPAHGDQGTSWRGALRGRSLGRLGDVRGLSAEEVYERLPRDLADLQREAPWAWRYVNDLEPPSGEGPGSTSADAAIERHWTVAYERAVGQHAIGQQRAGSLGNGSPALERQIERSRRGSMDWRAELWQYLVRTPMDFAGVDRRFVAEELYLDVLDGESLRISIAVDTSGSVNARLLSRFVSEVVRIVGCYPHVEAELFWADHRLDGPHLLTSGAVLTHPRGRGGTDFRPFFEHLELRGADRAAVAVYLTDGYGMFPAQSPTETIWVVPHGGRDASAFPFGQVLRMPAT
jgi:predicted metal-dependent peptidase